MNYLKVYNKIIERSKNRILNGYCEKHHIIPKCLGGGNESLNIVKLTAREHFLCHQLLCEIYPYEYKLKQALWLMGINKNKKKHQKYKISNRLYERLKLENSLILRKNIPLKKKGHDCYKDPERGKKISKSLKGYKQKIEHLKKRIEANSKAIQQFDLKENLIKEWGSCTIASKTLNINLRSINNNLKKISKSAGGYKWKYK